MIIGLTGLYCAGKNYVASILEKRGLLVLDLDKLGHSVIESKKQLITERFGNEILKNDGTVDRYLLGTKVFGNKIMMEELQKIVHPEVNRMTNEWIAEHQYENCVLNAAVLHKSDVFNQLSLIILVCAPFLTRLLRAKKRDKLPWKALIRRFMSQKRFSSQYLSKNADTCKVKNPGIEKSKLELQINSILVKFGL